MIRLGVNVDHIATIRNARDEAYPHPNIAAGLAEIGGADNITCHLREDRRHIRDNDVALIRDSINIALNFEMAVTDEMLSIAKKIGPDSVSLVPEKREEKTTEGGLNVDRYFDRIKKSVEELKEAGAIVCLFVEADLKTMELSKDCGADAVELHTGTLVNRIDASRSTKSKYAHLKSFIDAAECAHDHGMQVHVGHGIHYGNAHWIQSIPHCEEANIGHSIVARASLVGMTNAVREMKELLNNKNLKPIID